MALLLLLMMMLLGRCSTVTSFRIQIAWEDEMSGVRRAAVKTLGSFASSASSSSSSTSDDTVSTTTTTRGLLERSQQKTSLTKVYAMAEVKMEILKQGGSVMFDLVLDPSPQVRLESLTELFRVCSSLRLDRKQIENCVIWPFLLADDARDGICFPRRVATRVLCASPSDLHILTKMMLKILSESKTENVGQEPQGIWSGDASQGNAGNVENFLARKSDIFGGREVFAFATYAEG
eukprot:jgi/Bigna1/73684/fgenesh1_pg.25_\